MQKLKDRLCRLVQAVRSPSGLQSIERHIQQVLGQQYNPGSDSAGAAIPVPKAPPSLPGQATLVFDDPAELQDWEEALELCESLLDSVNELPLATDDFGESVREKTESIQSWIKANKEVAAKQLAALDNMSAGVSRWLH